jgi:hypothetical protein
MKASWPPEKQPFSADANIKASTKYSISNSK